MKHRSVGWAIHSVAVFVGAQTFERTTCVSDLQGQGKCSAWLSTAAFSSFSKWKNVKYARGKKRGEITGLRSSSFTPESRSHRQSLGRSRELYGVVSRIRAITSDMDMSSEVVFRVLGDQRSS